MAPHVTDEQVTPPAVPAPLPSLRELALAFTVTKACLELWKGRDRDLRDSDVTAEVFERGETFRVRSPLDRNIQLATLSTTNPKPEAVITDRAALFDWMMENHPDRCEEVESIRPGREAAVIAALREHLTPDEVANLVDVDKRPADYEVAAILTRSAGVGQPIGPDGEIDEDAPPGITVQEKKSAVSVKLDDGAADHILELWRTGQVDVPALPTAS